MLKRAPSKEDSSSIRGQSGKAEHRLDVGMPKAPETHAGRKTSLDCGQDSKEVPEPIRVMLNTESKTESKGLF